MRISSICYINSDGVIQLHKNVVEGLSIFDNSILFGVYYPRSKNENEDVFKEDFMITPIPYRLWYKTARLIIKIKKQSTGIKKISSFLSNQGVSILHSNSTRSGHRYSIWDIHISFDNIKYNFEDFDKSKSYFTEVYIRTEKLKKQILEKFEKEEDILFNDDDNYYLTDFVNSKVNTALHYFYFQTERNKLVRNKNIKNDQIFKEFTLRYNSGTITTNTGKKIGNIIKLSKPLDNNKRIFPTLAFIEGESHFLSFRLRIIPRDRMTSFFKLTIFHARQNKQFKSTKGLFQYIINNLDSNIKIWRFYNQLDECRETFGSGKLNFILEAKNSSTPINILRKNLENNITNLNINKPEDLSHIEFWGNTTPIYPNYIKHHFRNQREFIKKKQFDVFISYSTIDYKVANEIYTNLQNKGISVYMSSKELKAGDYWNDEIRDGLLNSRELCLLYTKNSKHSEYVNTEWGAAWFMKKTIVTILNKCGDDEEKKLDSRLKSIQYFDFSDKDEFEKYVDLIMKRRIEYLLEDDKNKYQ